jgi:hypothetical protein
MRPLNGRPFNEAAILSRVTLSTIGLFAFILADAYFRFVRAITSELTLILKARLHRFEQYVRPFFAW